MKTTWKTGVLVLFVSLLLAGCTSAFHNGTEMAIGSVKVTGLPANPYANQVMVFSYNLGSQWIHDNATLFADTKYRATTTADGSLTFTFTPPLEITTPTLTFLLINPDKGWDTFQVDKKHSGKKGGDASLDNQWTGASNPLTIVGQVSGDDVAWTFE